MLTGYFTEFFLLSFLAFFATINPVNTLIIFVGMSVKHTKEQKQQMAIKAIIVSAVILIVLMFTGGVVLQYLGISLPALKTAGGLFLFLAAYGMVFGKDAEGIEEFSQGRDISIFPLSIPVIAGPAAITTSLLLSESAENIIYTAFLLLAMVANLLITLVFLLLSDQITNRLNRSVIDAGGRVIGLLIASLAVQFVFDGIKGSGIFG